MPKPLASNVPPAWMAQSMAPDAVTCITKRVHEQVHARITTAVARLRRRSALLLLLFTALFNAHTLRTPKHGVYSSTNRRTDAQSRPLQAYSFTFENGGPPS